TIVLVTAIHATRQPGLGTRLRTITLHQHGAAAATGTVTQRVHATDHGDAVVASLTGVGGRRVHAVRAGVMHIGTVEQDIQARLALAANHRIYATPAHARTVNAVDITQRFADIGGGTAEAILIGG